MTPITQPFASPKLFQARASFDNAGIIALSSNPGVIIPPPGPNLLLVPTYLAVRCNTLAGALTNVNVAGCALIVGLGDNQITYPYWSENSGDSYPLLSEDAADIVGVLGLQELAGSFETLFNSSIINAGFFVQFSNGGALTGGAQGNFFNVTALYYIWNPTAGLFLTE